MYKVFIVLTSILLIACGRNSDQNKIVWASKIETIVPLEKDSLVQIPYLGDKNNYDKKAIFESIKNAVLIGRLKAYYLDPDSTYTLEEFKTMLNQISQNNEEPVAGRPGEFSLKPITGEDIVQMRFDEQMEMDTVNYTLTNNVYGITFYSYKRLKETGESLGYKYLFGVKFKNRPVGWK